MAAIMTSREFNQHTGRAMREADNAPLTITNRGKPTLVLLSYAEYQKLAGRPRNALEALTPSPELSAELEKIDFEIPPRSKVQRRAVDFGE